MNDVNDILRRLGMLSDAIHRSINLLQLVEGRLWLLEKATEEMRLLITSVSDRLDLRDKEEKP